MNHRATTQHPTVLRLLFSLALAVAMLAAAAPVLAQDWAGRGRLQGVVTDTAGNPLAGAKVTLYRGEIGRGPEPIETNKKGRWSYLGLVHGTWSVLIEYPNLVPSEGSVPVNEYGISETVKTELRPIPEAELQADAAVEAVRELDKGNDQLQSGQFAAARATYEAALEKLDPAYHHLVKIGIANAYLGEKQPDKAVATLEPLLAGHGDEAQLQQTLARAYYAAGQVDRSIDLLKAMAVAQPDDVATMQLLIDLLVRADRETEAQEYIAKIPEGVTLSADTVLNTGIKLYNNGDLDGALAQFDRAVADHPELPEAFYFRGLVHIGKEANDAAISDFKRFLELAPAHANATEARQFLEYLEGS